MLVLKSIEPVSAGKIYAALSAVLGLIYGICIALFFLVLGSSISSIPGASGTGLSGVAFGIIALLCIIGLPIVSAIGGFIFGVIGAFVYNVIASWIGGIQVDLK